MFRQPADMQAAKRICLREPQSLKQENDMDNCPAKREQPQPATDGLPDWRRWCRLCAKDDPNTNVSIYCKREGGADAVDSSLATAIGKYFWVNIRDNDALPRYICTECHTLVTWLSNFTDRVNKVQAMYCLLQNSGANPNKLRRQYGLLDAERDHIIQEHGDERLSDMTIKILREESQIEEEEEEEEDEGEELEYQEEPDGLDALHEDLDTITTEDDVMNFEFADDSEIQMPIMQTQKQGSSRTGESHAKQAEGDDVETEGQFDEPELKSEKGAELDATGTEEELDDSDLFKELKYKESDEEGFSEEVEEDNGDEEEDGQEDVGEGEEEQREPEDDDDENETAKAAVKGAISRSKRTEGNPQQQKQLTAILPPQKAKRGRPPKFLNIVSEQFRPDTDSDSSRTEVKYQCSVCGKNYKNPTSYRKHMLELHHTAPEIPDFKCQICAKIYPTEHQLALHERVHLPLADKLDVPCPYCDRKFTKTAVMRQHISGMHHKMKPFICDECGRALKTLAALNEHKLVHTNDTPFECEICHKGFKNKARLKVHSEVHTETSFMCTLCGLKLNTRRTLKMHMLVHSDNKRFKCDFCQAAFKRSKALKNHLILHSGMRPYKCHFCGKTFSNGSNCRAHKKKTHSKELAEEEAQGKKTEMVTVPKLEDLRSSQVVVQNPRKVQRHAGGLSLNMRALLIAAEERAKRTQEVHKAGRHTMETEQDAEADTANQDRVGMHFIEGTVGAHIETDEATEVVEIDEVVEDHDEEEEEETIIYEIIDEI